ncbi:MULTISPECIES: hypothetical protein [unclassified Pseudonocardia]|uniref:hypothetical protein n=1 Tax=unclassified Pseudonocardia TaxID=2619320 RepID=UPI0011AEBA89|nr:MULTISPECIES: hypothetical protein [unclassified Pseudonocardia]
MGIVVAPSASAHGAADPSIAAVLDRVALDMPGVSLTVQTTSLGSQFVLENPTPTEATVMSAAGDPLFRIGPEGVLANFRSPDWYTSKLVGGDVTVPPRAVDRGTPVWVRVSQDPAWGWFDHRLHDAVLTDDQKDSMDTLEPFGAWSVPVGYGDRQGTVDGHFEYRPPLGSFVPSLENLEPAPGVRLAALPGNPVPGVSVENRRDQEVIVLGEVGEPFLRLTGEGVEHNELSPTWLAQQSGQIASGGDPAAAPQWVGMGSTPQASFTVRGAEPDLAPAELYAMTGPADVKDWSVAMVIDGQRVDVAGVTTFTPVERGGDATWWWIGGSAVLLLLVGAGLWWWLRRGRSGHDAGPDDHPAPGSHRREVGADR